LLRVVKVSICDTSSDLLVRPPVRRQRYSDTELHGKPRSFFVHFCHRQGAATLFEHVDSLRRNANLSASTFENHRLHQWLSSGVLNCDVLLIMICSVM
jgi:hypothetical protein